MSSYKKADIDRANKLIKEFEEKFSANITMTNAKGMWTFRVTRKTVQVFIRTGQDFVDCLLKGVEALEQKKKQLGWK